MNVKPHRDYDRIAAVISRILVDRLTVSWSGVVFRSATPKYADQKDLIKGFGSKLYGGRWNAPGTFPTVYASTTPELAMAETLAYYRFYGISVAKAMPRTFKAIMVKLSTVLDLRAGALRQRLRVSEDRMMNEPWRGTQGRGREALTQALGRAAQQSACEGLLVRSAQGDQGHAVVVFPDNLQTGSVLKVKEDTEHRPIR
ncbi:MAG: RES family NAD+ phosphorylase [Phycisphaerae bacterium]|nr:RES family NAD+ phosphorylase [Phycisphaerae bacterium]